MGWPKRKKNKYNAQTCVYDGHTYHSRAEARYATELDLRVKAGELDHWERQKRIALEAYGCHICNYYIDFILYYADGRKEYVEIKGLETATWKLKWKMFLAKLRKEEPGATASVRRV